MVTQVLCTAALVLVLALPLMTPRRFVVALVFGLIAFPKSGVKSGDIPLPFCLALVLLGVLLCIARLRSRLAPGYLLAALVLWSVTVVSLVSRGSQTASSRALLLYWVSSLLILSILLRAVRPGDLGQDLYRICHRSLASALVLVLAFGVGQYTMGTDWLQVPGLTIAWGDSYDLKPLLFEGGVKVPSTYQNGNLLGIVAVCLIWYFVLARRATRKELLISMALVLVVISASRSAMLALLTTTLLYLAKRSRPLAVLGACLVAGVASVVLERLSPSLASRYAIGSFFESGAGGRNAQWAYWWSSLDLKELLFGDPDWRLQGAGTGVSPHALVEGLPGMIQQVGLVGVLLLATFVFISVSHVFRAGLGYIILPVIVATLFDSSYTSFPVLWTSFLLAALALASVDAAGGPRVVPSMDQRQPPHLGTARPSRVGRGRAVTHRVLQASARRRVVRG